MLVKRTRKNQFTLPKVLLIAAGIGEKDEYFDAEYDTKDRVIRLKPVSIVIEERFSEEAIARFEEEALRIKEGDKLFKSRKEADHFLKERTKK